VAAVLVLFALTATLFLCLERANFSLPPVMVERVFAAATAVLSLQIVAAAAVSFLRQPWAVAAEEPFSSPKEPEMVAVVVVVVVVALSVIVGSFSGVVAAVELVLVKEEEEEVVVVVVVVMEVAFVLVVEVVVA
jgi:uncharacterized membrane protein YidH (DUF202 family)